MRCDECPADSGMICPSARHPHYCTLANREGPRREYWREFLRTGAIPEPQDGAPPPPVVRPAVDGYPLYLRFGRKERFRPDLGVVCASDDKAFPGLKLMLASLILSHDVRVTVFDLGMTGDQRRWLDRQPVSVVGVNFPDDCKFDRRENRWTLWVKPYLMRQSPYETTVWLDSDVIVDRDLGGLIPLLRDRGVAIFPDTFAKPHVILNRPELYEAFPVAEVFPSVNSGVMAWRAGHPFVSASLDMLRWVKDDPDARKGLIGAWDQGCIKWAVEALGIRPIHDSSWNRPGWTVGEMAAGTPLDLDGLLARCKPGEIAHFQGTPKPWETWGPLNLSLRPAPWLSLTILGHEPFTQPGREWITPSNLSDADPDQSWGECRHFDRCEIPPDGYVGLASVSWRKKYAGVGMLMPWEFGELDLWPDVVHCAARTDDRTWFPAERWEEHMEHFNPGILPLIDEIREVSGRREVAPSAWSNNWVMHRDVFADLVAFYRRISAHFNAKYPVCPYRAAVPAKEWAYLGEAITVHYLATRGDLEFRPIRRAGQKSSSVRTTKYMTGCPYSGVLPEMSVPEQMRLGAESRRCPSRGCRTSCSTFMCERFGTNVDSQTCLECTLAARIQRTEEALP